MRIALLSGQIADGGGLSEYLGQIVSLVGSGNATRHGPPLAIALVFIARPTAVTATLPHPRTAGLAWSVSLTISPLPSSKGNTEENQPHLTINRVH